MNLFVKIWKTIFIYVTFVLAFLSDDSMRLDGKLWEIASHCRVFVLEGRGGEMVEKRIHSWRKRERFTQWTRPNIPLANPSGKLDRKQTKQSYCTHKCWTFVRNIYSHVFALVHQFGVRREGKLFLISSGQIRQEISTFSNLCMISRSKCPNHIISSMWWRWTRPTEAGPRLLLEIDPLCSAKVYRVDWRFIAGNSRRSVLADRYDQQR